METTTKTHPNNYQYGQKQETCHCGTIGSSAGVKRHMVRVHHEDWRVLLPTYTWPRTRSEFVVEAGERVVELVTS